MSNSTVLDLETCPMAEQDILARLPEWDESEALSRKGNRTKPETINAFLEEDRADYVSKAVEKAALTPEFCQIVCVGLWVDGEVHQFALDDSHFYETHDTSMSSLLVYHFEKHLLERVWLALKEIDKITGWNVFFDANMLIRRSWILGVPVPVALFNPLARHPFGDRWLDMMELYKAGRRDEKYTSLDNALKALGLPPKTGSGKDFPLLWQTDRRAALAYSANDCVVEAEIGKRMGVIRTPEPAIPVMTKMDMEETLP